MAKEVAISKRLKITKAQQNMLLAVLIASVILGAALSISINLIKRIAFNADVITAKDKAITKYSKLISEVGVCRKPAGAVYTEEEIKKCNPDAIDLSEIQGSLRANILENLAANPALNSVLKEDETRCVNSATGKNYTYEELQGIYQGAQNEDEMARASDMIKTCSALRVIPDALPAYKNEEALLASLNKILNLSGWQPEALMPGDTTTPLGKTDLLPIGLNLTIETDNTTTMNVLNNIERSIRLFNLANVNIDWIDSNHLKLGARAAAYYVNPTNVVETTETISAGDKK